MARRTKEEAAQTRTRILDTAELLFLQNGVSRTSLQMIAAEAGLTRGAVYWHFKDKGHLFNAMMERVIWPMEQACMDISSKTSACSPADAIALLQQTQLECLQKIAHCEQVRRILEIAICQVEYTQDLQVVRQKTIETHRNFYESNRLIFSLEQVHAQMYPGVTPESAALTMQSILSGLINNWIVDPGQFNLVEEGRRSINIVLQGLVLSSLAQ